CPPPGTRLCTPRLRRRLLRLLRRLRRRRRRLRAPLRNRARQQADLGTRLRPWRRRRLHRRRRGRPRPPPRGLRSRRPRAPRRPSLLRPPRARRPPPPSSRRGSMESSVATADRLYSLGGGEAPPGLGADLLCLLKLPAEALQKIWQVLA